MTCPMGSSSGSVWVGLVVIENGDAMIPRGGERWDWHALQSCRWESAKPTHDATSAALWALTISGRGTTRGNG